VAAAPQCREELTLPRKSPKSLRERSAVASKRAKDEQRVVDDAGVAVGAGVLRVEIEGEEAQRDARGHNRGCRLRRRPPR